MNQFAFSFRSAIRRIGPHMRRPASFAGGFALLGVIAFVPPATSRHIGLASSVPAKDSHVMTPLSELRLTFTGPVNVAKAGAELVAADGANGSGSFNFMYMPPAERPER